MDERLKRFSDHQKSLLAFRSIMGANRTSTRKSYCTLNIIFRFVYDFGKSARQQRPEGLRLSQAQI